MQQLTLPVSLEHEATFSSFYAIDDNQLLIDRLCGLESRLSGFVYVWGAPESGVSHLLQASVQLRPESHSVYLPLAQLIDMPPTAVLENIELVDMVAIDDIGITANRPDWQDALFHAFNRIKQTDARLVIGAHQPPAQLDMALADLQSRLTSGEVYQLTGLSDEQKILALQWRAANNGFELTDEVVNFVMSHYSRSTARLFSLLSRLDKESLSKQRKITIPLVKSLL